MPTAAKRRISVNPSLHRPTKPKETGERKEKGPDRSPLRHASEQVEVKALTKHKEKKEGRKVYSSSVSLTRR